jgi:ferredoxin
LKENVVFYFSGTGNSLQVARDLAEGLGDTELINIGDYNTDLKVESDRIGIVFPVYCWGPPLIVNDFANKLKLSNHAYLFMVATYGGHPGASLKILKETFDKRKILISSTYAILMPGNCIRVYGALPYTKQQQCFEREKESVDHIVKEIKAKAGNMNAAELNPVGTAIIKKLYCSMMKSSYDSDQYYSVDNSCNSCGLCEHICPVHNIVLEAGKPVWHHKCESCMACIQRCPQQAINYKHKTQKRKRYVNPNIKF